MDLFCDNCGARLAEGAEWCTQCYAPVAKPGTTPPGATPPAAAPADAAPPAAMPTGATPAVGPTPPGQPGTQAGTAPAQRIFDDPRTGKTADVDQQYYETPEFSRWRKGPESFGLLGRSLLTILLLGGLAVGFWLIQAVVRTLGGIIPTDPLRIGYGVVALIVALWGLSKIWKRARIK